MASVIKVINNVSGKNVIEPSAIELKIVLFCLGLYLIEIVFYSFIRRVIVACMKKNVEKYFPH